LVTLASNGCGPASAQNGPIPGNAIPGNGLIVTVALPFIAAVHPVVLVVATTV
jgi:hypothetical protein